MSCAGNCCRPEDRGSARLATGLRSSTQLCVGSHSLPERLTDLESTEHDCGEWFEELGQEPSCLFIYCA
jgi:hypothetical protein